MPVSILFAWLPVTLRGFDNKVDVWVILFIIPGPMPGFFPRSRSWGVVDFVETGCLRTMGLGLPIIMNEPGGRTSVSFYL